MTDNSQVMYMLTTIMQRLDGFDARLTKHMAEEESERQELLDEMRSMRVLIEAFPTDHEGNPRLTEHKEFHEEASKSRRVFDDLKMSAAKRAVEMGVTAAIILVGYGLIEWIKRGIT